MANDEINEAISAWFEPKPDSGDKSMQVGQRWLSAKGCWEFKYRTGWQNALDYFTSEDANARLRDAMLKKMSFQEWADRMLLIDPTPIRGDGFEFKQKQVLAFLKFAGIAHKRDGGEGA